MALGARFLKEAPKICEEGLLALCSRGAGGGCSGSRVRSCGWSLRIGLHICQSSTPTDSLRSTLGPLRPSSSCIGVDFHSTDSNPQDLYTHRFRSEFQRTLLCMWMVYSRATTSEMADRLFLVFFFCVFLSLTILTVCEKYVSG